MHVLTLTPFYPTASDDAAGCFVAEPLRLLPEFGAESSVIAAQPWYRGSVVASPEAPPASWVRYPALPSGLGLSSAGNFLFARLHSRVCDLHRLRPIDLIHAHAALPCGHAAALLGRELNIPFVVTVHGLDAYMIRQVRGIPGQLCKRVSRMVYRSATRVICISEKVREQVLAGAAVPTAVIYNGVDPQAFLPSEDDTASTSLLTVGNLIPIKAHELLVRALAALPRRDSRVSCDIIGDGPERSRLQALAAFLGVASRVRFLGRQSRSAVAQAMRRCSVFALPSRYEGLGCVYLEAMSSGKPVIACRGQGIEEIIHHGVNGWLIQPEDLRGLTEAISALLQDLHLRRRLGGAARDTILQGCTMAHQAAALAKLYRECVV
jgi:teichuronic acid biosynthesis glycosyltransferase TuaC